MKPIEKLRQIARLQGELLRDGRCGHPDWYAEMLFAAAFNGTLMPTNHPKYDMKTEQWGSVQVKCRVNGTDTTQNRSKFAKYKVGDFDHAAIVLFEGDFRIRGAVVLSCTDVLALVRRAGHVKWSDASTHTKAISVLDDLRAVSGEATQPNVSFLRTPDGAAEIRRSGRAENL